MKEKQLTENYKKYDFLKIKHNQQRPIKSKLEKGMSK